MPQRHIRHHRGTDRRGNSHGRSKNVLKVFLANAVARPSSVVCQSVAFVRPTQALQTFGNISTALGTLATH